MTDLDAFLLLSGDIPKKVTDIKDVIDMGKLLFKDGDKPQRETVLTGMRQIPDQLMVLMREQVEKDKLDAGMRYYKLTRTVLQFLAPHYFVEFMIFMEFDREPAKRFFIPRQRQLKVVADSMQDLEDDKLDLVCVSLPPGTGKTTLGTFFLAWVMGRDPDGSNLASGHSSKLTRSIYDGVSLLIGDPEYNYKEVFPNVVVEAVSTKDETINFNSQARFKTLTCRSIDGSLTGVTRCENYLYADDLVSGIEEALSIERLDSLWFKYSNDLKSRKKTLAKEIHVATRWSVHDPIGRLERLNIDNPRARFISISALNDKGESNFDYPYSVGFSTEFFNEMRQAMDEVSWRTLYMNEPIEREGLLLSMDELNWYNELPNKEPDGIICACDPSMGKGDDTVMPVGYVYGQDVFIEDAVCNGSLPDVTQPQCANMIIQHKVKLAQFESNSAGWSFADTVADMLKKKNHKCTVTKKANMTNKQTRIVMAVPYIKNHFYFKNPDIHKNPQYSRYISKLTSYSISGTNKNDDCPDATAQLSELVVRTTTPGIQVFKRPF